MKLIDMVEFLFSKNAGPYVITYDLLFKDKAHYDHARRSGVFNKEDIAKALKIPQSRFLSLYEYDAGYVIKFSVVRDVSSGDFGDRSVFGSQQWPPLIDWEIPD